MSGHGQDVVTHPDLDRMLAEIEELPSIPETLIEIMQVIDNPESGANDLAGIVRLDAPLSAKILRLANSPFYGSSSDVTDITRCIAVLGYRTMRNVAITLTVATSLVSAVARAGGRLDYRELWRHSVITGAIAKHLAILVGDPEPEEIFAAGLLHDLGKFVLELHAPEAYDKIVHERRRSRRYLSAMERETFGYDHAEVGAAFAASWRFPEILVRCIGDHHQQRRPAAQGTLRGERAAAIVSLADYLANAQHPPSSDLGGDIRIVNARALYEAAGIAQALVEEARDDLAAVIDQSTVFLSLT